MDSLNGKNNYRTSCILYLIEACFLNFINNLVAGSYLAKLTTSVGVSDSTTAILSTLITFTGAFQLISIMLSHKRPVKRWASIMEFSVGILLGSIYLLPFMKFSQNGVNAALFIMLMVGFAIRNIVQPIKSGWFLNLPSPDKRGVFQSSLSIVSMVGMIILEPLVGRMIDIYEAKGELETAFIIIFAMMTSFAFICLICLLMAKEKPVTEEELKNRDVHLIKDINSLLHNKMYMRYFAIEVMFGIAQACCNPFLGTYKIIELGFSMTFISVVSISVNIVKIVALTIYAKLSRKHDFLLFLEISFVFVIISYLVMTFTTPKNGAVMFVIYSVLNIIGMSSHTVSAIGVLSLVKEEEDVAGFALQAIVLGVLSFLTTMAVTPLFNYISITKQSQIFGRTIYAQQILHFIGAVLFIGIFLYTTFVFAKKYKAAKENLNK